MSDNQTLALVAIELFLIAVGLITLYATVRMLIKRHGLSDFIVAIAFILAGVILMGFGFKVLSDLNGYINNHPPIAMYATLGVMYFTLQLSLTQNWSEKRMDQDDSPFDSPAWGWAMCKYVFFPDGVGLLASWAIILYPVLPEILRVIQ